MLMIYLRRRRRLASLGSAGCAAREGDARGNWFSSNALHSLFVDRETRHTDKSALFSLPHTPPTQDGERGHTPVPTAALTLTSTLLRIGWHAAT